MRRSFPERYGKAYFDRWYRDPKTRVKSKAAIARKAIMALSIAEYYLERPVRTVLDVGCGEGNWFPALKSLRPGIRYSGVDSSSYAVSRFGKRRNICSGTFGTLENLNLYDHYDLVICSDALFYLTLSELKNGLKAVAKRTGGVAFLELYTRKDSLIGDFPQAGLKNVSFYRKLLKNLGFVSVGSHCYLGPSVSDRAMEMEKG
jgi:SAM-dependent methyltransferase